MQGRLQPNTPVQLFPFSPPAAEGFLKNIGYGIPGSPNRVWIGRSDIQSKVQRLIERVNNRKVRSDAGRHGAFDALLLEFADSERRIQGMLRDNLINSHDFGHQQRVAGMALAIADAVGLALGRRDREVLGVASSFHDMGYPEIAEGKISKAQLGQHAEDGANMFTQLIRDPSSVLHQSFRAWSSDDIRNAWTAIYYHNGGSDDEYARHRSSISLLSKLTALGDKLDNRSERVFPEHLHPTVKEDDPTWKHHFVPAAIQDIRIGIDATLKRVDIVHAVDTSAVSQACKIDYALGEVAEDFHEAYKKAMLRSKGVFQDVFSCPAHDHDSDVELHAHFADMTAESIISDSY